METVRLTLWIADERRGRRLMVQAETAERISVWTKDLEGRRASKEIKAILDQWGYRGLKEVRVPSPNEMVSYVLER